MNDGQDFHAMGLEKTLSACFGSKDIRPFVYVGIEANSQRLQEYGTASTADFKGRGKKAAAYSKFILEEFLPFLHSEFNISPRKEDRVYCGMSLGGLTAFDIVINHPHLFGRAGVFSGSFWWRKAAYVKADLADRSRIMLDVVKNSQKAAHLKFWFQCGSEDETADRNQNGVIDAIDDTQDLIKELKAKGYRQPEDIHYVEIAGGRHDHPTWGRVFPEFIQWAFKKPDRVTP
jgi:enterochelin esterase-like enzyme